MKFHFILLLVLMMLSSCVQDVEPIIYSDSKDDIKSEHLINPKEAYQLLADKPNDYIPIHVSKAPAYKTGHIKNAINIWRPDYGADQKKPYGGLIPSKNKLESLIQSFGFEKGKTLLLYDLKANVDALRFAWVLRLYGFEDFKLISGGMKNWELADLPVTQSIPDVPTKSQFKLSTSFNEEIIAYFDDVQEAITDTNTVLIDTREDYEYLGRPFQFKDTILPYKLGAFDRGSIPSSIHLNWSTFADLDGDHRIKSEKDLRHDLVKHGITDDKNIILYCHSGSRTSHTFYVLKDILGFENVKNYDGSWIEWSYYSTLDENLPMQYVVSDEAFILLKDSLTLSLTDE